MKKFFILFALVLLSSLPVLAQKYSKKDYPMLFAATDSLLEAYTKLSRFSQNEVGSGIDQEVIQDFRSLFYEGAKLADELAPKFLNKPQITDWKTYLEFENRDLEDYLRVRTEYFKGGMITDIVSSTISLNNIEEGELSIVILKHTEATCNIGNSKVLVRSETPLALAVSFDPNDKRMKIKNILILNTTEYGKIPGYMHLNDKDYDFVPDNQDADRARAGLTSGDGIPTDSELKERGEKKNRFTADFAGLYGFNSPGTLQSVNGLASYTNATDFSDKNIGVAPILSYGSIGGQFLLGYNLDRKARLSVAAGLRYELINGELSSDSVSVSYRSEDAQSGTNGFLRSFNSRGALKETFNGTKLAVPLVVRYKLTFNSILAGRLSLEAALGPLFNLSWTGKSTFEDNRFDYGGVYYFTNPTGDNTVPQIAEYNPANTYNLELTQSVLQSRGFSDAEINDILNANFDKGYDVGVNVRADKALEGSAEKFSFKPSVGFIFQPTLQFKVASKGYVTLGGFVSFTKFSNTELTDAYRITDKRGQYQTLINAVTSYTELQYAAQLGYRFEF